MKTNFKIVKQTINYFIKKDKTCLFIYFIKLILSSLEPLIYVYFSKHIVDNLYPELDIYKAILTVFFMVCLQFICSFILHFISIIIEKKAEKILFEQKKDLIKYQKKILYENTENSKFYDDYYHANEYINRGSNIHILNQLQIIISSIITICGLIYLIKEVSIIALLLSTIIYFIKLKFVNLRNKKIYEFRFNNSHKTRKENFYVWGFTNSCYVKENKLFDTFPYISKEIDRASNNLCKMGVNELNLNTKSSIIPNILDGIMIFIIYFAMAISYKYNNLSIGDYSMILAAFISFSTTINSIINSFSNINNESFYFDKYNEIVNIYNSETKNNINSILKIDTIEFKNVSYKYANSDSYALHNVNLKINSNEFKKISIVGENGSGKTTFIKLLMKLYKPTNGNILINGIDINDIDNEAYFELFSPVFQDFNIYNTSIRNNISFDEQICVNKETKQMDLFDTINKLQLKDMTNVSKYFDQNGIDFSGGEKQKIAICRALHKNSKIIILDEPTAALSANSENSLYKMVLDDKEKIIFFISHRLSSCRFTDRIIVFDNGNILEIGTHNELINNKKIYYKLFNSQAELYRNEGVTNE